MTIDEISNSGFKIELENKECEFSMITYQYAVKTQNAMYLLNNNEVEKGNAIINEIALKFLIVDIEKKGKVKVDTLEAVALTFKNPFAIVEINAQFLKYINVFLKSLPSFQKAMLENKQG